jgi:hypothetical protein
MTETLKRATIYLSPELHRALRLKAAETEGTISDLVSRAVRRGLAEDKEDLAAFRLRAFTRSPIRKNT